MGGRSTEGYRITLRGEEMEETGNTQGKVEASPEARQGPEDGEAPWKKKNKKKKKKIGQNTC